MTFLSGNRLMHLNSPVNLLFEIIRYYIFRLISDFLRIGGRDDFSVMIALELPGPIHMAWCFLGGTGDTVALKLLGITCRLGLYLGVSSTQWGQNKMANILQTTFSNTFCPMEMLQFPLQLNYFSMSNRQSVIIQLARVMVCRYLNCWQLGSLTCIRRQASMG